MNLSEVPFDEFDPVLADMINVAKEAGELIMDVYRGDFKTEMKEDNTPVTFADTEADKLIREKLSHHDYGFITEENQNDDSARFEKERVFVVDPIDGTREFVKKTGDFCVMIGVIELGKPIIGVVYFPVKDKLYFAQKGKGAYLAVGEDVKTLIVSQQDDISEQVMFVFKKHPNVKSDLDSLSIGTKLGIKNFEDMPRCTGLIISYISEGYGELFIAYKSTSKEWDIVAPVIILEEAGGHSFDLNGNDLEFNTDDFKMSKGIVITNGKNKDLILNEIIKYGDSKFI